MSVQPGYAALPVPLGRPGKWEVVGIVLITLLAAALRFYRLSDLPPGLHYDEAFKGVTARALLEGAPARLFFESDMGEEPIAAYLVAAALGLLGPVPWAIRVPSALIGTLTVPVMWWLGRELYPGTRGRWVGLLSALVLAILYWHLSFSRIGMEPILVPFFAALAFACLARGLRTGKPGAFALAGLALGGSLYTYKAGYFVPVLSALFVGYAALAEPGFLRRHARGLLLLTAVALVTAAPIALYFATHPSSFLLRPASVALGSGESAGARPVLWDNLVRVLAMFFVRGDANPRSNLPGRPALDPFLAALFLLGLGWALAHLRRATYALPVLWLVVMALPTVLAKDAPHFGRAIGATPAVALLCALGCVAVWRATARLQRRWASAVVVGLLAAGLFLSGASTVRAYYQTWGRSPGLFYAYDVGLVQIAEYVGTLPADEQVYVTPVSRDHYTLEFLLHRPIASFDGRDGLVFPAPGRAATVIVLLGDDESSLPALEQSRPDGTIAWRLADWNGRPYAAAYSLPASQAPAPLPEHQADAILGASARLLGYSVDSERVAPGGSVRLTLYWQALAPMAEGYTAFVHLLGDPNPATGGPVWAGHDGQPDGGRYPTPAWQPGEVILDAHPVAVPAETPPGTYQIEVGMYLLETLARLPATDLAGHPLPENAVRLGAIQVEP
jgi:4-amino-4-deoxy-L-arabinose transferase-like glycosyltransferase